MPQRVDPSSYQSPEGERPAISTPIDLVPPTHDPYAAFRFGDFSLFTVGNVLSITGRLMLAVAVEWEMYARTHSATALGDRKSTRLNSSHTVLSRMPSSA